MFKEIIDVTRSLSSTMAVYPGNEPFTLDWLKSMPESPSNLSALKMGMHTGTHVDAPLHFEKQGVSIDRIGLDRFCGNAIVLDFTSVEHLIDRSDFMKHDSEIHDGDYVLLKTKNSFQSTEVFDEAFSALTEDAARYLAEKRISLVGIDGPSIDRFRSGNHPAHHALFDGGVLVVEGLIFKSVDAGRYGCIILPLKVAGAEAAPARAILVR